MRSLRSTSILFSALLATACTAADVPFPPPKDAATHILNRVIVELEPTSASALGTRDVHARFLDALDLQVRDGFSVVRKYDSEVYTGAAIDVKNIDDVKKIAQTPGVRAVHAVPIFQMPQPVKAAETTMNADAASSLGSYPPAMMSGVEKIHAMGITGKGVKVAL